jgi:GT2 family glycosyltransferase
MHDLTASIVIYKSNPEMLRIAITSFLLSTVDSTLYLIDNSPTDKARDLVDHPNIIYVFNRRNLGFGGGHNVALRMAMKTGSKYHVVLNPDVYFNKEVIPDLHHFMESNKDIGLTMPKVLYPDGRLQPLCRLLPNPAMLFIRRFLPFYKQLFAKQNLAHELHFSGYNKIMDVPFLSGCFMFLRIDALNHVGLFDERIFLYTEDMDLSRRIHLQFRTVFFPGVTIYHHHQRGSYRNFQLLLRNIHSAVLYFNKWGWFFDRQRRYINERALLKLQK